MYRAVHLLTSSVSSSLVSSTACSYIESVVRITHGGLSSSASVSTSSSVSPFLTHWSRFSAQQLSSALPMAFSVPQWSASAVVTFRPSDGSHPEEWSGSKPRLTHSSFVVLVLVYDRFFAGSGLLKGR